MARVAAIRHGRGLPYGYVREEKRRAIEVKLQKVDARIASILRKKYIDFDRLQAWTMKQTELKIALLRYE